MSTVPALEAGVVAVPPLEAGFVAVPPLEAGFVAVPPLEAVLDSPQAASVRIVKAATATSCRDFTGHLSNRPTVLPLVGAVTVSRRAWSIASMVGKDDATFGPTRGRLVKSGGRQASWWRWRSCASPRLADVEPANVGRRMKDKAFARAVPRGMLLARAEELVLDFDEHVTNMVCYLSVGAP